MSYPKFMEHLGGRVSSLSFLSSWEMVLPQEPDPVFINIYDDEASIFYKCLRQRLLINMFWGNVSPGCYILSYSSNASFERGFGYTCSGSVLFPPGWKFTETS
jgi:hypothetical protein